MYLSFNTQIDILEFLNVTNIKGILLNQKKDLSVFSSHIMIIKIHNFF